MTTKTKGAGAQAPPTEARQRVVLSQSKNVDADVRALADALAASRAPYYRRGSMIVFAETLVKEKEEHGVTLPKGSVLFRPATVPLLRGDISKAVDVFRFDARSKKELPVEAPPDRVATLLDYSARLHQFRVVHGISRVPLMDLATGALSVTEGYDPRYEMLIHPGADIDFAPLRKLPRRPTGKQARAAVKGLAYLLQDFALENESRSIALSAFITAVLRPMFTLAPLHGFSAPQPGTGKTLLAQAASIIATGVGAPAVTLNTEKGHTDTEIDAVILGGYHVALLDNITGRLGGDKMCAAFTSEESAIKLMYTQQHQRVRNKTAWLATGNNLSIRADLIRRSIVARIDARIEHPEWRPATAFHIPGGAQGFLTYCKAHRLALLGHVFTIVRWAIQQRERAADASAQSSFDLGSFEEWNQYVRLPLLMLDQPDPLEQQRRMAEDDPDREARARMLAVLAKYGDAEG